MKSKSFKIIGIRVTSKWGGQFSDTNKADLIRWQEWCRGMLQSRGLYRRSVVYGQGCVRISAGRLHSLIVQRCSEAVRN